MKKLHSFPLILAATSLFSLAAQAETGSQLRDTRAGAAFDLGFGGVVEMKDKYRFFLGTEGAAADYKWFRRSIKANQDFRLYAAAGAWLDWDHDEDNLGVRAPIGVELNFAPRWEAYAQINPYFVVVDEFGIDFSASLGVTYRY
ncbi:hypothetical protein N9R79_01400 [Vibrio sp.]|nr:hypothetical protein [Vibrio sp.]